ncbi:hypothetical protein EST38_g11872 [Candolleomyces aberdarensis]|uniref:Uncharacterized protein n=1 Tax=Candolleomyces aberdarensis TaxID=2316362 RepID=A0A4Q2D5C9_9AGAR|nr:hypothetical protein EST38_g11872 [Candolleomyces aberdarensis]
MGRNNTPNVERAHLSLSHSQPSVSQEPKRKKKRQNNEKSTGRKPPKNMAVAQARKILAEEDLWGYRILRDGFDPEAIAGAPPAASVIDFASGPEGESYAMSMDHALCHKSLVPDDLVANRKPKHISQAMAYMTRGAPIPQANPGSSQYMLPNLPFSSDLPPNTPPPAFEVEQLLYPGTPFAQISRSPQPSEYSEFGSESTDAFHAGRGTANFDVPASYGDMPHIPMEQTSLPQMDLTGPSMLDVHQFQDDWSANYAITASFQNSGPQALAPFPFGHSNSGSASVPLTTMFNCPTTGPYPEGPYTGTNVMAPQNF